MSTPVVKGLNAHHRTMFSNSDRKVVNLMGQQCPVRLLDLSLKMYLPWVTIQYYHHPLAYSTFPFNHTICHLVSERLTYSTCYQYCSIMSLRVPCNKCIKSLSYISFWLLS